MSNTYSSLKKTRLDVVTGFLGAGKTTFLAQYTDWLNEKGVSYCIIENEFGKAGIDADILSSSGAKILEISGGCVCCTLKVTLHNMLLDLCNKVDRILLEPSGLFCGDDLLDIVHTPGLEIEPGFWTGIVDPVAYPLMTDDSRDVLRSELMHAGSILISKADMVSVEEIETVRNDVIAMLPEPKPQVFSDIWSEVTKDTFFKRIEKAGCVIREHERKIYDHTGMFQSTYIKPEGFFTESDLRDKLNKIMHGEYGDVLRVKGTILSDTGCWAINCTPGCVSIVKCMSRKTIGLNIIGNNLKREQIRTILT